jgi:hypothetical protein
MLNDQRVYTNPPCLRAKSQLLWLKSHGYLRSAVGDLTYDIPSPSRFHHFISYIPIILLLVLEYQKRV